MDTDVREPVGLQVVRAEQVLLCALSIFGREHGGEGRTQRGTICRIVDFQLIEPEFQIKAAVRSPAGWQVEKPSELGCRKDVVMTQPGGTTRAEGIDPHHGVLRRQGEDPASGPSHLGVDGL